jgi:hypothetical protein
LFELIWFPKEKVMKQIMKTEKGKEENQIKIENWTRGAKPAQVRRRPMAHPGKPEGVYPFSTFSQ